MKAAAYQGGQAVRSVKKGRSLTLKEFHGERLALRATTCRACGSVNVFVGKRRVDRVSLKTRRTRKTALRLVDLGRRRVGTVRIVTRSAKPVVVDGLGAAHS